MHDQQVQDCFVLMRSQGATFNRISQELNVPRGTLVNWSRKFQYQIKNLRTMELEQLQDKLIGAKESRAKALAERLQLVDEALKTRDLSSLSTPQLLRLSASLPRQILREFGPIEFTSPLKDILAEEYHDQVQDWKP